VGRNHNNFPIITPTKEASSVGNKPKKQQEQTNNKQAG
jgi:hypothetical protein